MTTALAAWGTCVICLTTQRLLRDGTVRAHRRDGRPCSGAHIRPVR